MRSSLCSIASRHGRSLRLSTLLVATSAIASGRFPLQLVHSLSTATPMPHNVVCLEGQQAAITSETSKEFLVSRPPGAYTTARTCAGSSRIFEWEMHVERTASSLASMMAQESEISSMVINSKELTDVGRLRRRLDAVVEQAVRTHQQANANTQPSAELKVTALVGWKDENNNGGKTDGWVACHVTTLPPLPSNPVRVEIRGSPRTNALAKDSAWVTARAPLEQLMASSTCGSINELLLTNEDGAILEGSQTNFYAVVDGAVWTAGEGILEGTVRRLVLDVCRAEGIPVVLKPPSLEQLPEWEGAILSSTSRLALPIDELYVPEEGSPSGDGDLRKRFRNDDESLSARIQRLVGLEVEARSTPIGEPVPI